jgi:hypothetical protein
MSKVGTWVNDRSWRNQAKKNGGVVDAAPYA